MIILVKLIISAIDSVKEPQLLVSGMIISPSQGLQK